MNTPDLPAPAEDPAPFIDLHVAQRIAERAANDPLRQLRILLWVLISAVTVGCILELFGVHLGAYMTVPYVYYLALPIFFGACASSQESLKVQKAVADGKLDEVAITCPRAAVWNYMWCPVTLQPYRNCLLAQERMLLLEGRFIELEAMFRYLWAQSEHRAVSIGIPKNTFVATHLVMALMQQHRYTEAVLMLQKLLDFANENERPQIHAQLALCFARLQRFDDADTNIKYCRLDAIGSVATQFTAAFAQAILQLGRDELEECETSLQKCLKLSDNMELIGDFQLDYDRMIGNIRKKQGRFEESELSFKNALDRAQASNNPDLPTIEGLLNDYAAVLLADGKAELAEQRLAQAQHVRTLYNQRERRAISAILSRLDDPKDIWVAPQILSTERRRNLLSDRLT